MVAPSGSAGFRKCAASFSGEEEVEAPFMGFIKPGKELLARAALDKYAPPWAVGTDREVPKPLLVYSPTPESAAGLAPMEKDP